MRSTEAASAARPSDVIRPTTLAPPQKRVDVEGEDVDEEVRQHEEDRYDDRDAHDGGKIERADGADRVLADTGPGKDDLDHQRAAEEVAELHPHRRDNGEERVPKHVTVQDDP